MNILAKQEEISMISDVTVLLYMQGLSRVIKLIKNHQAHQESLSSLKIIKLIKNHQAHQESSSLLRIIKLTINYHLDL